MGTPSSTSYFPEWQSITGESSSFLVPTNYALLRLFCLSALNFDYLRRNTNYVHLNSKLCHFRRSSFANDCPPEKTLPHGLWESNRGERRLRLRLCPQLIIALFIQWNIRAQFGAVILCPIPLLIHYMDQVEQDNTNIQTKPTFTV